MLKDCAPTSTNPVFRLNQKYLVFSSNILTPRLFAMARLPSGELKPGLVSATRVVPHHINRPEYVGKPAPAPHQGGDVYDFDTLTNIRKSSSIAAEAVLVVAEAIRPGVTTDQLDEVAHEFLLANNAYPSTLGYRRFPKSICTSVNEVICHGIPDDTVLQDGDIINIDITAFQGGAHGDTNATFLVGDGHAAEVRELVANTQEALNRGIKAALPGRQVSVIGRAIESYAKRFGYGVIRDFTGHGVGTSFHTGLVIPHYDSTPLYSDVIKVGMVFTIEPMLTLGGIDWEMWEDGWTVVTKDRSLTAQFEHTILIKEDGPEILTKVNKWQS